MLEYKRQDLEKEDGTLWDSELKQLGDYLTELERYTARTIPELVQRLVTVIQDHATAEEAREAEAMIEAEDAPKHNYIFNLINTSKDNLLILKEYQRNNTIPNRAS